MLILYEWMFLIGAGALWHGWQILWAGGLPRQLRKGETPQAEAGSKMAFQLFWLDQYAWIGVTLSALGVLGMALGIVLDGTLNNSQVG